MITVQCRKVGWNQEDFKREFDKITVESEEELMQIGRECLQVLKDNITGSIKRSGSTGKLANAFTLEEIRGAGMVGWGIGDINKLYKTVPYFFFVDHGITELTQERIPYGGRKGDQGVKGLWDAPMGGRFQKGYKMMYPKRPIRPLNYSIKTLNWLLQRLSGFKPGGDNARDISGKPGSDVKDEIYKITGTIFNVRPA